jgi:nucleoside-diphosphate-sugar epimerase
MKILLTGSSGFLGKYLQNALKLHSLRVLNRSKSDFNYDLASEVPIINEKFELVIHNAGYAHIVPQTKNDIQLFHDVNVSGTINLLNSFSKAILPQKFVFISSVSVYGLKKGLNINEDYPLLANDPYGKSKIDAEKFVLNWCNENNIICTILRLPLIAGSNPPGNLGSMINGIKKGYYFNIGKGKAKKSMVFAEDVARSILKVAEIGGIYNLTDGYHPSFAELSKHIFIQLGKGKPMNMPLWLARIIANIGDLLGSKAPLNTNKFDKITSNLTFDDSKAREAFGWSPTPVLEGFKLNTNVQ